MNNLNLIVLGIAIFLLSVTLVRLFCSYAITRGIIDIPNARSSHFEETPRGGGLIFVLLWSMVSLIGFGFDMISRETLHIFLPGTLLVSLLGYWDDHKGLSARRRFFFQTIAACISLFSLSGVSTFYLTDYSVPFSFGMATGTLIAFLGIVWSTNLYNFMDGIDGVAAIEALFVFGLGGLLFWLNDEPMIALLAWVLIAAVSGFLVWNWPRPKARIFMGDVGSYCLGFLVAIFAIIGDVKYQIPITLWLILYGVFWFDATVTLFRRLLKKENVLTAHREHACQRLHRAGFSHKQVLLSVISLNALLGCLTLWAHFHKDYLIETLLLAIGILVLAYLYVERLKPMMRTPT